MPGDRWHRRGHLFEPDQNLSRPVKPPAHAVVITNGFCADCTTLKIENRWDIDIIESVERLGVFWNRGSEMNGLNTIKSIFRLIAVFCVFCGSAYGQYPLSDPDRLRFYDQSSSYRCSRRIIAPGDYRQSVLDKCGEPAREAYIRSEGYDVWIYQEGNYVYYLLFLNGQLERILSTRCWNDNPDCEPYMGQ